MTTESTTDDALESCFTASSDGATKCAIQSGGFSRDPQDVDHDGRPDAVFVCAHIVKLPHGSRARVAPRGRPRPPQANRRARDRRCRPCPPTATATVSAVRTCAGPPASCAGRRRRGRQAGSHVWPRVPRRRRGHRLRRPVDRRRHEVVVPPQQAPAVTAQAVRALRAAGPEVPAMATAQAARAPASLVLA